MYICTYKRKRWRICMYIVRDEKAHLLACTTQECQNNISVYIKRKECFTNWHCGEDWRTFCRFCFVSAAIEAVVQTKKKHIGKEHETYLTAFFGDYKWGSNFSPAVYLWVIVRQERKRRISIDAISLCHKILCICLRWNEYIQGRIV